MWCIIRARAFSFGLAPASLSSPGLTGRSGKHRSGVLDRAVKPGNDTAIVSVIVKCSNTEHAVEGSQSELARVHYSPMVHAIHTTRADTVVTASDRCYV